MNQELQKDILQIYCDGACSGNPGPGGWGAILIWQNKIKKISGFEVDTTNNRMELTAAIMALKAITRNVKIVLHTDSKYLCTGITVWIKKWKQNNWISNKKKVKNVDLWEELDSVSNNLDLTWCWVKGHSGNHYNEEADALAKNAIELKIPFITN